MATMNSNEDSKTWRRVEASERYTTLDLLRGLALFGVLLINLLYFFRVSLFDHILHVHSHAGWVNHAVDLLVTVLVEFKAFDLFALHSCPRQVFALGVLDRENRLTHGGAGPPPPRKARRERVCAFWTGS